MEGAPDATTQAIKDDGFAGPIDVLSDSQAVACLAELDAYASKLKLEGGAIRGLWRFQTHLFLPWVAAIVTSEALLRHVRAALGSDDILCWFSEWHIKPPQSEGRYTPHQDSTYAGLDPPEGALTAWVALTDADEGNGAVAFYPRSHHKQLPHVEEPGDPTNLLLKGQRIPEAHLPRDGPPVLVPLKPGQATLHAFRLVHASGPNRSADRRVGLAIRYITSQVRQTGRLREGGVLVSGRDSGHFDLRSLPAVVWDPQGVALHRAEMETMSVNYMEQQEQEKEHRG